MTAKNVFYIIKYKLELWKLNMYVEPYAWAAEDNEKCIMLKNLLAYFIES
jgi:hypothetical protein